MFALLWTFILVNYIGSNLLQVKTSNTLPTTPEVNEDGGSRTVPPSAATTTKEKPGNCILCIRLAHCCRESKTEKRSAAGISASANLGEYFYKKNPRYMLDASSQTCSTVRHRQFLFKHSTLHAFKFVDQFDDCLHHHLLHRQSTNWQSSPYSLCHQIDDFVAVKSAGYHPACPAFASRVDFLSRKPPSGLLTKRERLRRKRRNLYTYPTAYYNSILKNLEREASLKI